MRGGRREGAGRPKGSRNKSNVSINASIEEDYAEDPVLLRFYQRKLARRGWPGSKDMQDKEYIRRARWGS